MRDEGRGDGIYLGYALYSIIASTRGGGVALPPTLTIFFLRGSLRLSVLCV